MNDAREWSRKLALQWNTDNDNKLLRLCFILWCLIRLLSKWISSVKRSLVITCPVSWRRLIADCVDILRSTVSTVHRSLQAWRRGFVTDNTSFPMLNGLV